MNDVTSRLRRTVLSAAGLAALLAITACGDDLGASRATTTAPRITAAATTVAGAPNGDGTGTAEPGGGTGTGGSTDVAGTRALIVSASIAIESDDVDAAVREATRIATEAGGLVTTADVKLQAPATAKITLRVPPDQVDGVLDALGAVGRVTSRGKSTEDVTTQVVDLQARIDSARKSVERARQFLDQATRVQDLADLEAQLAQRETALEQLLAQQRELDDLSSLAAIDVTFTAKAPTPGVVEPTKEEHHWPGPLDALRGSVHTLGRIGSALLLALAALSPFLGTLLIGWILFAILRRPVRAAVRRPRKGRGPGRPHGGPGPSVPPPPPAPPAPDREPVGSPR